jgi:hypothetical protein
MTSDYMTEDQRFASRRTDVLVYRTPPLDEDMTIAGPIKVNLEVSTSGTDSDFVVKLVDVYPNDYPTPAAPAGQPVRADAVKLGGYQQLVRGEPFRGKYRKSFEKPEPFVPGEPTVISFELPDVYHAFRKGHSVMVQVQSSWFPLVDRNPQVFMEIPTAKPADFKKATQRVYRSNARASSITVMVQVGVDRRGRCQARSHQTRRHRAIRLSPRLVWSGGHRRGVARQGVLRCLCGIGSADARGDCDLRGSSGVRLAAGTHTCGIGRTGAPAATRARVGGGRT